MQFTSNHDENTWQGPAIERLGDAYEMATVLTFAIPGMPLIYGGQEAGLNKSLSLFEKDPIPWKRHRMAKFYKKLIQLKKENKSLWNGKAGGGFIRIANSKDRDVFTFRRDKGKDGIVCFLNFSDEPRKFQLRSEIPDGTYKDFFTGEVVKFTDPNSYELPPWGYRLFTREK